MVSRFSDEKNRNQPNRARQVWLILVGKAMNRQTVTYKQLSELMFGKTAAGVLDKILGHIAYYCEDNDLPQLNAIVVNSKTGVPGDDIPLSSLDIHEVREKVYQENWYDIIPPHADELKAAFKQASLGY
ncbi:hypothetical protein [Thalassospira australica]|uniref:hypothetical protein n=1 Tax=Thalassospira australica TaxID=1528106 RepID=UPI00384D5627